MAIPMAASMQTGEDSPFDRLLRDSVANESNDNAAQAQTQQEEAPIDSELEHGSKDVPDSPEVVDEDTTEQVQDVSDDGVDEAAADLGDDVTKSVERGDGEQPTTSSNQGKDANRSQPVTSEPLIAATLQNQNSGQQLNQAGQNPTQQAPTAKTVEPTMRGTVDASTANSTRTKAPSVQGAYSARSAAQAQLLEQARDSVFKQIMMKLHGEGGEVRMRLQPPDLGQLDLRMTVEGGNKLSLTISADRQDINSLLQRHLDELKLALQESGLEITGAEVQTRSEFESQQAQRDAAEGGVAPDDTTNNDAERVPQPSGFTAAGGLNFLA
ncbi:MAG: flagellar hook-length control protein FliK [Planctomycetota bacterium]|jgi:flagellar hook-length control protein FliK